MPGNPKGAPRTRNSAASQSGNCSLGGGAMTGRSTPRAGIVTRVATASAGAARPRRPGRGDRRERVRRHRQAGEGSPKAPWSWPRAVVVEQAGDDEEHPGPREERRHQSGKVPLPPPRTLAIGPSPRGRRAEGLNGFDTSVGILAGPSACRRGAPSILQRMREASRRGRPFLVTCAHVQPHVPRSRRRGRHPRGAPSGRRRRRGLAGRQSGVPPRPTASSSPRTPRRRCRSSRRLRRARSRSPGRRSRSPRSATVGPVAQVGLRVFSCATSARFGRPANGPVRRGRRYRPANGPLTRGRRWRR